MTSSPPERFGTCRVLEQTGQGPLTVFYCAVQESTGRLVAIKALRGTIAPSSPLALRLEREARLLASFHHHGVVALHDFVRTEDAMWLVLEYVDGIPLAALLERAPQGLGVQASIAIALQIAHALAHVHERGVIHRDLKPGNVLLSLEGEVKLFDFGIAHQDRLPSSPEPITDTGGFGTPAYMSPEQLVGEELDARSDLFSLGVVLYQMLAGVLPFEGPDMRVITQRIRHDAPTPLTTAMPGLPPALERLVERLLEKFPVHRFASAWELIAELEHVQSDLELAAEPHAIAQTLVRLGVRDTLPPSLLAPRQRVVSRPAARHEGIGRAVVGQLLALGAMILGGSLIQAHAQEAKGIAGTDHPDTLELVPEHGASLRVIARPWASVFVNGQFVDVTPFAKPVPLAAGSYQVSFKHPAAPEERRTMQLTAGESALMEVEMKVPAPPPTLPLPSASAPPADSTP